MLGVTRYRMGFVQLNYTVYFNGCNDGTVRNNIDVFKKYKHV